MDPDERSMSPRQSFIPVIYPTDLMVPRCHHCGGLNPSRSDPKLRPHRDIVDAQDRCSQCLGCPWKDTMDQAKQLLGCCTSAGALKSECGESALEKSNLQLLGRGERGIQQKKMHSH